MKPLHSEFVRFQVLVPVHFYFSRGEDNSKDSAIVLKCKWRPCQDGVGITSDLHLGAPWPQLEPGPISGNYLCRNLGCAGNSSTPHTWRPWAGSQCPARLSNSHNKPELLQVHQAPCARAWLVHPHRHSSSLCRTPGYLGSLLKSDYFSLSNFPVGRGKKRDILVK